MRMERVSVTLEHRLRGHEKPPRPEITYTQCIDCGVLVASIPDWHLAAIARRKGLNSPTRWPIFATLAGAPSLSASFIFGPFNREHPTDRSAVSFTHPLRAPDRSSAGTRASARLQGKRSLYHMQIPQAHEVGRYLVTPMTKLTDTGQYAASVSIRRGMHDRVFRLIPRFDSAARAARYALMQGRHFVLHNQLA